MPKSVVIVDPVSTGKFYADKFKKKSVSSIAILSSQGLPRNWVKGINYKDFEAVFHWNEEIYKELKSKDVLSVIAGAESAIVATDLLSEQLGVFGNPVESSLNRRHKEKMQLSLKENDLNFIPSIKFQREMDVEKVISQLEENKKYVVKPINSASSDGVAIVQGKNKILKTLSSLNWEENNFVGEKTVGFIIQPFIDGDEYVVDMVATQRGCVTASICKYKKISRNGGDFVYHSLDVLDPNDPSLKAIKDYAHKAANALDINIGPVHMEIIDSEAGPVMIEAGARLHGGIAPKLFESCYKPSLLDSAVDSYLDNTFSLVDSELVSNGRICFLYADKASVLKKPSAKELEILNNDPCYLGHHFFMDYGEEVSITNDFTTCPGLFWLSGDSDLSKSEAKIRELLNSLIS